MQLEIIKEDITKLSVNAIVNAANNGLLGGGGVDGAIHNAAGLELLAECKELRRVAYPGGLPTGQAVVTKGYNLPAKYIIHTVGPIYDEDENPGELLRSAYGNSLNLAEKLNLKSIAFPAISTGVYGYPKQEALHIVAEVMSSFPFKSLERVILCYFSEADREMAEKTFRKGK
ncbi:MAG: O-acetyl-ADP-ribose deacetylase [Nanoarchaeota archaeon]|mgnify:FL=1